MTPRPVSRAIAAAPNTRPTSRAATSQSRADRLACLSARARAFRTPSRRYSPSADAPLGKPGTCTFSISSHRRTARSKSPRLNASSHRAAHLNASAHSRVLVTASSILASSFATDPNLSMDSSKPPPKRCTDSFCALVASPRRRMPSRTPSSSRMARVKSAWCSPHKLSTDCAFSRRIHSSASMAFVPVAPTCAPEMTPAAPRASAKRTSGAARSSGCVITPGEGTPVTSSLFRRIWRISSAMRASAGDGRTAVPSASSSSAAARPASFAAAVFVVVASSPASTGASAAVPSSSEEGSGHSAMVSITNHSCAHCCADISPSRSTSSLRSHRSNASTVRGRMTPSRTPRRSVMAAAARERVTLPPTDDPGGRSRQL